MKLKRLPPYIPVSEQSFSLCLVQIDDGCNWLPGGRGAPWHRCIVFEKRQPSCNLLELENASLPDRKSVV
jgi:hypothetical protein